MGLGFGPSGLGPHTHKPDWLVRNRDQSTTESNREGREQEDPTTRVLIRIHETVVGTSGSQTYVSRTKMDFFSISTDCEILADFQVEGLFDVFSKEKNGDIDPLQVQND